jgi:integrase/recombinase XerD
MKLTTKEEILMLQNNEFENYLKINTGSKNTQRQYLMVLTKFFQTYKEFNQTTVNDCLRVCVDNNYKASTFNCYIKAFKHYAKFTKTDIEFPKWKRPNKTKKSFLTLNELESEILPYFDYLFKDTNLRKLIVRLMFTSGLRPCEVLNLKKTDLDFKNNWIVVKDTKDKEDRITLLVPNLHEELKDLCKQSLSDKLFNITETYIIYTFNKLNEMLNYKKHLSPYCLRHSFAHHCLKNGIDLKRVKEMMGHWDIKMTEEYLDLEPTEIIDVAVKKFKFRKGVK